MHGALLPAWLHAAKVRANKGTRKIVSDNNGVFVVKFIIILSLYYYLWEDKVADKDVKRARGAGQTNDASYGRRP